MMKKKTNISCLDDVRLAKRLDAGDEAAFKQFFTENYDRMYRFALSRLANDHATTEDIVQQSFSNALDRIGSYRGEAQLFTWLCTICRHQIIDWQRKQGSYQKRIVLIEDYPEIQAVVDSFQAPIGNDPYLAAQREEAVRLIQVTLDRLPVAYGDILESRYLHGDSAKEIAARLNLSVEAVNSLTARAKKAFIEIYAPLARALIPA